MSHRAVELEGIVEIMRVAGEGCGQSLHSISE